MGGHAFLAFLEIIGGVFHICTKQFGEYTEFKGKGLLGAEAILSYSVVGVLYGFCCCFLVCFKYNHISS